MTDDGPPDEQGARERARDGGSDDPGGSDAPGVPGERAAPAPARRRWARVRPWRSRRVRRVADVALTVALAVIGAAVAVALFGRTEGEVGPFDATFSVQPALHGGTEVHLAPLGRISLDSHDGPLALHLRVDELREDEVRAIAEDPRALESLEVDVEAQVRAAVRSLALRTGLAAVLGAAAVVAVRRLRPRDLLVGLVATVVLAGGAVGVGVATYRPESLAEPRYTGLLSLAPGAVGDARDVIARFDDHRAQLAALVENVSVLYQAAEGIRAFRPDPTTVRVLHVSDLHLNPEAFDIIARVVEQFGVDVVADTGDINDWGTAFEADFVELIGDLPVPYVYVRGNHDSRTTQAAVAAQPNAVVLDGDAAEVAGIRFWGIGDPRFTPDKSREGSGDDQGQVAEDFAATVAEELVADSTSAIDVALVHDPRMAGELGGLVPLVLAGHTHQRATEELPAGTVLRVEGSTGAAGLRALQRETPVPLSLSVLYLDSDRGRLEAIDGIEVAGVTQTDVRIEREVVEPPG